MNTFEFLTLFTESGRYVYAESYEKALEFLKFLEENKHIVKTSWNSGHPPMGYPMRKSITGYSFLCGKYNGEYTFGYNSHQYDIPENAILFSDCIQKTYTIRLPKGEAR